MGSSCWKRRTALLVGVTFVALTYNARGAEEVVWLRDNFNANTPNTTDLNVDLLRQTGTLAPIPYTLANGPGHYAHQLQNVNASNQLLVADFTLGSSSLNWNFNNEYSDGGLIISFDVDGMPAVYNSTPDHWGAINLGMVPKDQLAHVDAPTPHFGVLFRAAGTLEAWDEGTRVSPTPELAYTTSPGGMHHIDLVITDDDGNPFDGNGDTIIEIFADERSIWTYRKAGGYSNNFINVQGSSRAHFDNLVIRPLSTSTSPKIVTSLADDGPGSLRRSIALAGPGGSITFATNGVITLTSGALRIARNLTITGPGPSSLAVSGKGRSRVFEIERDVMADISGLTICDGNADLLLSASAADLSTLAALNSPSGGGIYNAGTLLMNNCVISSNRAPIGASSGESGAGGGGIYNLGSLTLTACTVSHNSAGSGRPGASGDDGTLLKPNGSSAGSGGSGGPGGGILNLGTLSLHDSTLNDNAAGDGAAGGVGGQGYGLRGYGGNGGEGGAGGVGGGVYNGGTLRLNNCTLYRNRAGVGGRGGDGGGVGAVSLFTGGNAGDGGRGGDGGGIYNLRASPTLTVTACTLNWNSGGTGGIGGDGFDQDGTIYPDPDFKNGYAGDGGNGGDGGGIFAAPHGSAPVLRNVLLGKNLTGFAGASGHTSSKSGAYERNAGRWGTNGLGADLNGMFLSARHNLVANNDTNFSLANQGSSDRIPPAGQTLDPLLAPLSNNGGPTFTLALLPGSPAIDGGDDSLASVLSTDQRGVPRLAGEHVDIGAFEVQPFVATDNRPHLAISAAEVEPDGDYRPVVFGFAGVPDVDFTVVTSTNVSLPLRDWSIAGPAIQTQSGQYRFTNSTPNSGQRFYTVRMPEIIKP